jgi:hypothetical protein
MEAISQAKDMIIELIKQDLLEKIEKACNNSKTKGIGFLK